tara:strand:+ start:2071 stop:2286 length:216 start_codon:yes stop_codon:yes gene_type:complete
LVERIDTIASSIKEVLNEFKGDNRRYTDELNQELFEAKKKLKSLLRYIRDIKINNTKGAKKTKFGNLRDFN